MRKLNIDQGDLELAFSTADQEMQAYFDTETGKTQFVETQRPANLS